MSVFKLGGMTLKSLFTKSPCSMYPVAPQMPFPATRGHIVVDMDTCVLCGICAKKCPTSAISVDKKGGTWAIEPFGCIQCENCVDSCPKKCLAMDNAYTNAATTKTNIVCRKPAAEEVAVAAQ